MSRLLSLLVLCACATAAPPSWHHAAAEPETDAAPAAQIETVAGDETFAPAGAPATRYNDGMPARRPSDVEGELVRVILEVAARDRRPLALDPRLSAVAEDMARVRRAGPQPYDAIELSVWHHGMIEPGPQLYTKQMRDGDLGAVTDELRARLPEILASAPFARVGVAQVPDGDGISTVVVALQQSGLETEPVPRELPRGGSARVRGRVLAPYSNPEVWTTAPSGAVTSIPVVRAGADGFRAEARCAAEGRMMIEVAARDPQRGPSVLANFPIWCGVPAPRSMVLAAREAVPADAPEIERQLLELANRDRARAGLPPLLWDERAAQISRAHSTEMRDKGYVAHMSPVSGVAADRARRAGLATPLLLENLARDYSVREAHAGLMNSPGHRANLLNPLVTHAGMGVALGRTVSGEAELYVTQLLFRVTPKLAPGEGQRAVAAAMARARASGGLAPLVEDVLLSRIAADYAAGLAAGRDRAQVDDAADRALSPLVARYAQVVTVITVSGDPADAVRDAVLDATSRVFGVGVSQGKHPQVGEDAMYIVILLAKPR